VGSHIVEHLLNLDHNVVVLDNRYPSMEIMCEIEQSAKSKFILCDITRYNDVYRAFNHFKKRYQKQLQREQQQHNNMIINKGEGGGGGDGTDESQSIDSLHSVTSSSSFASDLRYYKVDCVFHCAALTDPWAHPTLYEKINVNGTRNVIRACQECNIHKLVYTSSTCVVLDGSDCQNGDESMKYVAKKHHLNAYSYSKQQAEELVLLANNSQCCGERIEGSGGSNSNTSNTNRLLTCALRPHCIFGPRDTHFISRMVDKGREGKITHMIGEGHNITDFTFIDNVVHAHMLAAKGLKANHAVAAGQVYFITNGEPTLFWSFLGAILQQLGCPRPTKYISYNVAYAIALIMEFIYMLIGWIFGWRPIITRQMVVTMACHHWFSHCKATRDLGYRPIVTLDQGIKRTVHWHINRRRQNYHRSRSNSSIAPNRTDSVESMRSIASFRSDASFRSNHSSARDRDRGDRDRDRSAVNRRNLHQTTTQSAQSNNSNSNLNIMELMNSSTNNAQQQQQQQNYSQPLMHKKAVINNHNNNNTMTKPAVMNEHNNNKYAVFQSMPDLDISSDQQQRQMGPTLD